MSKLPPVYVVCWFLALLFICIYLLLLFINTMLPCCDGKIKLYKILDFHAFRFPHRNVTVRPISSQSIFDMQKPS